MEHYFADFYNANNPAQALTLVHERLSDQFVDHSPAFGGTPDKAGFGQTVAYINSAFTQQYQVEKLLPSGKSYTAVWSSLLTHTGEFMGVAPTQKQFTIRGITVYDLQDNKISAHWEQFDVLTILQNLGIVKLP